MNIPEPDNAVSVSEIQLPSPRNYIDGSFSEPASAPGPLLHDPNTGGVLQDQRVSDGEQIADALAAVDKAYRVGAWEEYSPAERAQVLELIADRLAAPEYAEKMALADALTTGTAIRVTRLMASLVPFVFRGAAAYIRGGELQQMLPGKAGEVEYFRKPWGPSLLISPWNGPTAIGSHKIASALAAGAPCILKPSEWTPHSALIMAEVIAELDLPRGTFQLVCGNGKTGATMVEDPRIRAISFTGGIAGGQAIASATAGRFVPLQLELGGNNPLVVMADADLDAAAEGIVYGLTNLNAQWCRALGRLLVHRSVKDDLLEIVVDKLRNVKMGHSLDETSDMGPLIHKDHYQLVQSEIDRLQSLGGNLISATPLPDLSGYFIAPTLVDGCTPEQSLGEIFGPVACIHTFDTEEEALVLANGTAYGLAAYVYSKDEQRARVFARRIRCGGVKINGFSLLALSGVAPRGAWGVSGLGEEGTRQSIDFFTGARVVGVSPQDVIGGSGAP
ncbi:aldehyde dehydrogenase [Parahaliea maris]|uniref:Aldehyde dehydrogenase n=1 Tax=Parahaliea maris TaxID=2716870 RepID=A0A5C9AAR4_9GAMM|nr:aldehyde dehydrogenase family protein [Parahaliea maris]TXS96401.1 aldehyde dehydrogenase [Parahaliea maris]